MFPLSVLLVVVVVVFPVEEFLSAQFLAVKVHLTLPSKVWIIQAFSFAPVHAEVFPAQAEPDQVQLTVPSYSTASHVPLSVFDDVQLVCPAHTASVQIHDVFAWHVFLSVTFEHSVSSQIIYMLLEILIILRFLAFYIFLSFWDYSIGILSYFFLPFCKVLEVLIFIISFFKKIKAYIYSIWKWGYPQSNFQ